MSSKKVAILGYNREGKAALKYFQDKGDNCVVFYYRNPSASPDSPIQNLPQDTDTQEVPRDTDFTGLLDDFDLVVRTADILPHRIKTSAPITSNTIEFFAKCPAQIIGVTGTKGKSTTSSLIAEFLRSDGKTAHLVGNIGDAPLESLAGIKADDWVVFELSSFQLADLKQSPHIAVHLMVEPDHLDIHPSAEDYFDSKANIFKYQKPDDVAVYYAGDKRIVEAANSSPAKTKIAYDRKSTDKSTSRVVGSTVFVGEHKLVDVSKIKLLGEHVLDNVCAACSAVYTIVNDGTVYARTLAVFKPLPHRLQTLATIDQVEYIDDAISKDPTAALAAIQAIKSPKVLILGGQDDNQSYQTIVDTLDSNKVKGIVILGQTSTRLAKQLEQAGFSNFVPASNMEEVVKAASQMAKAGDVVLLSPGAKSYDMFSHYGDRGDQFVEAVSELKK